MFRVPGLNDLLIDRVQLNEELLHDVLLPVVGIDGERQEIVPKAPWSVLSPDAKILVFCLGRKAMATIPSIALEVEGVHPKEIEEGTGVPGGTLRPKLRLFRSQGLLTQDTEGRYYIPTHAVTEVSEVLKDGASNEPRRNPRRSTRSTRNRRRT